ncbi:hypothetical protein GGI42DRAFT_326421 [Trichoderma sp. SZMC 28013]
MFYQVDNGLLNSFISRHSWISELAGILPLSSLIDFIEIRPKKHILELSGAVPMWSWAITPAGSRLLLSSAADLADRDCLLDCFGETIALEALDGRYGDRYYIKSPGTLRLVFDGHDAATITNDHQNMTEIDMAKENRRVQNLEIVHLTRYEPNSENRHHASDWRTLLGSQWRAASNLYIATSLTGWLLLIGLITLSVLLNSWISFYFLLVIPITGVVIFCLYGIKPRRFLVESESDYNRLVVVTEHMNSTDWFVIFGESTIVNSFLNRQLSPEGPSINTKMVRVLRHFLRILILGQWALALGSAATKRVDSYIICFWIAFSIFCHSYLITPTRCAKDWSKSLANLNIERYHTKISTRRALLNTILALNPDAFPSDEKSGGEKFFSGGLKWIDPILAQSQSRSCWEEATLMAMKEAGMQPISEVLSHFGNYSPNGLSGEWNTKYPINNKENYWAKYIPEGIYLAAKIKQEMRLPGKKVRRIEDASSV